MNDIAAWMRSYAISCDEDEEDDVAAKFREAADALEACQAENERLREVTYQTRMFMWKNRAEKLLERAEKAEKERDEWKRWGVKP